MDFEFLKNDLIFIYLFLKDYSYITFMFLLVLILHVLFSD